MPAILAGALGEWNEFREYDFYASQEEVFLRLRQDYERVALDCRAHARSGPFDPSEPSWVELDRIYNFTRQRVSTWDAAAKWFSDAAAGFPRNAALHSRLKQQHRSRLLLLRFFR